MLDFQSIYKEICNCVLPIFLQYRTNIEKISFSLKSDNSLLTEADIEIQKEIIKILNKYDKNSIIIAEEKFKNNKKNITYDRLIWIVDPIDGTRQFCDSQSTEYCCSVCALIDGIPVSSMIFMPELGINNTPILAYASTKHGIFVNDKKIDTYKETKLKSASTTRSRGTSPSKFEQKLFDAGYSIKYLTTSQSIDLLRTSVDLSKYTEKALSTFDIFYREKQWLWDGLPGICFNLIAGNSVTDNKGNSLLPLSLDALDCKFFESTVVGPFSLLKQYF